MYQDNQTDFFRINDLEFATRSAIAEIKLMSSSQIDQINNKLSWERYCSLQYYNPDLPLWLDISRMSVGIKDIKTLERKFHEVFKIMDDLELGSIANTDEQRQVGHYWLRNPQLAPDKSISEQISNEINIIESFSKDILNGQITSVQAQKFTDVLWIGIGGSSLGPVLIIKALSELNKGLNFHFLDNIDPDGINETLNALEPRLKTTLFVVVSKSGGTPEPRIGMNQARHRLELFGGNWPSQSVAITMKDSKLHKLAITEGWLHSFDLPSWVGGRTSITSSVGLLPAALKGIDIKDFLKGASIMDVSTRVKDISNNPAALLSAAWYISGESKGYRDMVVIPYKDRLEVFSRYLQQLVMESLGKKLDRSGNQVHQGIAVYGNKGSTDQHAYVQQLRDGIDNFFVTFIEVLKDVSDIRKIDHESPGDYLSGFLHGTRLALSEGGRQSLTITIEELSPSSLGALIALFERSVGFYAELININAYNQPGVEAGKSAATNLLGLQKDVTDLLSDKKSRTISEIANELELSCYESIFFILRHLNSNHSEYQYSGEYSKPHDIKFYKI